MPTIPAMSYVKTALVAVLLIVALKFVGPKIPVLSGLVAYL